MQSMDKRKAANRKARAAIEGALMELLRTKNYSAITVTDIVEQAGVARATYYRNYDSIEDVVDSLLMGMRDEILGSIGIESAQLDRSQIREELFEPFVRCYRLKRREILSLHNSGFSDSLLTLSADFAAAAIGDMPASSVRHYDIYALPGAMYNVLIHWLETGCKESDQKMAAYFANLAKNMLV